MSLWFCLLLPQPYQCLLFFIPSRLVLSSIPQPLFPVRWEGSSAWCRALGEAWSMDGGVGSSKGRAAAPQSIRSLNFLQGLASFYFEGLWVTFSTTFS